MQCKDCTHQTVCKHKQDFDTLNGQLPITVCPFNLTLTCSYYVQEQPQVRGTLCGPYTGKAMGITQE